MSARTQQLAAEMIALAEQTPAGWNGKIKDLYKSFEKALNIDAKSLTAIRLKVRDFRNAQEQAKAASRNYERLNYEKARIEKLIEGALEPRAVRRAFEKESRDPVLAEVWKDFAPSALRDKKFRGGMSDRDLLYEIEHQDLSEEWEHQLAEIEQGIAERIESLSVDGTRAVAAITKATRFPTNHPDFSAADQVLKNFDPHKTLNTYFKIEYDGEVGKDKITFLREDIDPDYDGAAAQARADNLDSWTSELKTLRAEASEEWIGMPPHRFSPAWDAMEQRSNRIAVLENAITEAGGEVPPSSEE